MDRFGTTFQALSLAFVMCNVFTATGLNERPWSIALAPAARARCATLESAEVSISSRVARSGMLKKELTGKHSHFITRLILHVDLEVPDAEKTKIAILVGRYPN